MKLVAYLIIATGALALWMSQRPKTDRSQIARQIDRQQEREAKKLVNQKLENFYDDMYYEPEPWIPPKVSPKKKKAPPVKIAQVKKKKKKAKRKHDDGLDYEAFADDFSAFYNEESWESLSENEYDPFYEQDNYDDEFYDYDFESEDWEYN